MEFRFRSKVPYETLGFVFIPSSLEYTDKYIEVVDGNFVTSKQKGQVQIKMCDKNSNPFITTSHNILLALDLCDKIFSIIVLLNLGYNCLFQKGFCTVYFGYRKKNAVTLPRIVQRKHGFFVRRKEKTKSKKIAPRNKFELGLLNHILGHRSTRSLMVVDNEIVWQYI